MHFAATVSEMKSISSIRCAQKCKVEYDNTFIIKAHSKSDQELDTGRVGDRQQ